MNTVASHPATETTEAVIISGSRQGGITHLQQRFEDVSPRDLCRVLEAPDKFNVAPERLS